MTSVAVRERATTHRPIRDSVELCVEVLGDDLTAYLAGANSVDEFRGWAGGPVLPSDPPARRVAAAAEVIGIFATVNRTALTAPWLSEVGPAGIVPARALRESSGDPATAKALHEAAEAWTAAF
jgi:hypothetical protein